MVVSSQLQQDSKLLTIQIVGKFDFGCHQQFRQQYEECDGEKMQFAVDLSETTYMDSSALGMLLLLRDHAGGELSSIQIINANSDIRQILKISNFHQLFQID